MAANALAVANEFIELAKLEGRPITHMKLQKLLYFAHGWYLGSTGLPLFSDPINAWKYGPVIHNVYERFKKYGDSHISAPVTCQETIENGAEKDFIKNIWELYKKVDAMTLSNWSHEVGGPWHNVKNKGNYAPISNDLIQNYFSDKLKAQV